MLLLRMFPAEVGQVCGYAEGGRNDSGQGSSVVAEKMF